MQCGVYVFVPVSTWYCVTAQGAEEMAQMEHLMNVYASKAAKGGIAEFLGYCEVAASEANYRLTEGLWLVSSNGGSGSNRSSTSWGWWGRGGSMSDSSTGRGVSDMGCNRHGSHQHRISVLA